MNIWTRIAIVGVCWSAVAAVPARADSAPEPSVDPAIAARVEAMEEQYGVRIQYEYVPGVSIPEVWNDVIVGTQVSSEHAKIMLDEIDYFMGVVPRPVIEAHLDSIHLFGSLINHGRGVGAMAYGKTICLVAGPASHIRNCLFHELAHILEAVYPIDLETWMAALPEGFTYLEQGSQAMPAGFNPFESGEELWADGFVLKYSKFSLSEDFAVFSDYLFSRPEKTRAWAEEYPAMRKRVATLIRHYQSISPDYDFSVYEDLLPTDSDPNR